MELMQTAIQFADKYTQKAIDLRKKINSASNHSPSNLKEFIECEETAKAYLLSIVDLAFENEMEAKLRIALGQAFIAIGKKYADETEKILEEIARRKELNPNDLKSVLNLESMNKEMAQTEFGLLETDNLISKADYFLDLAKRV